MAQNNNLYFSGFRNDDKTLKTYSHFFIILIIILMDICIVF